MAPARRKAMTPAEIQDLIQGTPKKPRKIHLSDSSTLEQVTEPAITIPELGSLPVFEGPKTLKATSTVWKGLEENLTEAYIFQNIVFTEFLKEHKFNLKSV